MKILIVNQTMILLMDLISKIKVLIYNFFQKKMNKNLLWILRPLPNKDKKQIYCNLSSMIKTNKKNKNCIAVKNVNQNLQKQPQVDI